MFLLSFKWCHLVDMYPLCRDKTICDQLEEHPTLYQEAAIMSRQRPDLSWMSLEQLVIWLVAALSDRSKSLPLIGFSLEYELIQHAAQIEYTDTVLMRVLF